MTSHATARILLVAPFPYSESAGQGGATVCARSLALLRQAFDVGMVCFSMGSTEDRRAENELQGELAHFESVPMSITKPKVARAKLLSLLLQPEHTHYFNVPAMHEALNRAIDRFRPDFVIYQFPQMAQYLPRNEVSYKKIVDVQDAYSVSWFRRACTSGPSLTKIYAYLQWLGWIQYERQHYSSADQVWTLSAQDKFGLSAYSPSLNPLVMGLPLDTPAPSLPPLISQQAPNPDNGPCIGFICSFGHPPNVEALMFLNQQIAPRIQHTHPSLRFLIAGRNPPQALVSSAPSNVSFLGFVDSLPDFYASCDLVVAPLLSGGGIKIKVAEALAYGKALVATSIGVEGLDIEHGRHFLLANSAEDFVAQIQKLLSDPALRQHLQAQANLAAQDRLNGQTWLNRVKDALLTA